MKKLPSPKLFKQGQTEKGNNDMLIEQELGFEILSLMKSLKLFVTWWDLSLQKTSP